MTLHPSCAACARRIADECLAFTDPQAMWRPGPCWGYTDDPERVERELADCVDYTQRCGGKTTGPRRDLQRYQSYYDSGIGRPQNA